MTYRLHMSPPKRYACRRRQSHPTIDSHSIHIDLCDPHRRIARPFSTLGVQNRGSWGVHLFFSSISNHGSAVFRLALFSTVASHLSSIILWYSLSNGTSAPIESLDTTLNRISASMGSLHCQWRTRVGHRWCYRPSTSIPMDLPQY